MRGGGGGRGLKFVSIIRKNFHEQYNDQHQHISARQRAKIVMMQNSFHTFQIEHTDMEINVPVACGHIL